MSTILAFLQVAGSAEARADTLGPFALTFMLLSMGSVTILTVWCFARVLTTREHFDPDGTGPAHAPVSGEVDGPQR